MSSEKSPTLYTPQKMPYEDEKPKSKMCSKSTVSWILAVLLLVLIIVLSIQFLYPVMERRFGEEPEQLQSAEKELIELQWIHSPSSAAEGIKKESDLKPWHLDFLINPEHLCATLNDPNSEAYQKDPEVKLLMIVTSRANHFLHRKTIRGTWGSIANQDHGFMRLGFVVGTTPNATDMDLVIKESEYFNDIIQGNFEDTSPNLTTKSIVMLKWVAENCAHAEFFLKANDDTFVNVGNLAKVLLREDFASEDKFIGGHVLLVSQPSGQIVETDYLDVFYSDDEPPPHAAGSTFITTGPTAADLFKAAQKVPSFTLPDDFFTTGQCCQDIEAALIHDPRFMIKKPSGPPSWNDLSTLATAQGFAPDDLENIWEQMTKTANALFKQQESLFNKAVSMRKR